MSLKRMGQADRGCRTPSRPRSRHLSLCLLRGCLPGPLMLHTHVLTVSPREASAAGTVRGHSPAGRGPWHTQPWAWAPTGWQHSASQRAENMLTRRRKRGSRGPVLSQWLGAQNPRLPSSLLHRPQGWQASLQALSLPELSGALEERVREMGESRGCSPPAVRSALLCAPACEEP